ncbi:MAG TPA: glycosyltransferase family 87 protein [Candidatus Baltobacteraceae bacterium]|nr:glycosyltransferase family 87 protein [Candidatus Baltobacteraceae bacterium]
MRSKLSRVARVGGALLLLSFIAAYAVWRPLQLSGPPMTDFSAYYSAGRSWSHGIDPYGTGIWSVERLLPGADPSREELLPYVGPPLSLPLWALLGTLPYQAACAVWGVVVAACAGLILVVPAVLAGRRLSRGDAVLLLLLGVASGPLIDGVSLGQAALPASAAVDVAILCLVRGRFAWAALAAIVGAALKPNVVIVLAAALRGVADSLTLAASGVVYALANVPFAGGFHGLARYLGMLSHQGGSERFYAYQMTPTAIAFGFGMSRHAAALTGDAVALTAVALTILAIVRTRARCIDAAAIACAAFPFVVPYEHEPDMAVAFLPALIVIFRARGGTWAAGALGTVLLATDPFGLAQGRPGLAFSLVTATVVALQLLALASRRVGRLRFVPLAAVAVVAVVGFFGPPSRLPMWPAALPQHVAVAPNSSANAIWHDEIVASGLETERPWASTLRLLTLAGCVAIGVAMTRVAAETERAPDEARGLAVPLAYGRRTRPAEGA